MKDRNFATNGGAGIDVSALGSVLLAASAGMMSTAGAQAVSDPASAAPTVEEIVVTAQRREQKLSDVPIAITAYSGAALSKTGVVDTRGLTQVTPGLNFQSVGSSAQPNIRGVGSTGSSVGDSSNIAMYVDGVYQPLQGANFMHFVDIDRIEVLKGPQGTLFGRNATGGAINVITLEPSFTPTGRLGLSYSRFEHAEAFAYVSAPLIDDKLAFNLSADVEDSDGFRRDINLRKQLGYIRSETARGKLLFKPNDRFDMLLTGYYVHFNDLTTFGNQPLRGDTSIRAVLPDVLLPTETNTSALNIEPYNRVTSSGASLRITADFDWATLTSLSALGNNRQSVFTDSDLSPVANSQSNVTYDDDAISQDLVLTSNDAAALSWLFGATYFRERGAFFIRSYGGLLTDSPNPPLIFGLNADNVDTDAYAAFAEVTWRVTDRLSLIAGGRYSIDKPSFDGRPLTVATNSFGARLANSAEYKKFTPRAAVNYAVTPEINAYASYTRGFKAGVFNTLSLQVAPAAPETIDAYEIGIKGTPTAAFSFDASAFYYDYKDVQFQSYGATTTVAILRNAARERIKGFEANATVSPLAGLSLRAGLAYTDGEYTDFPGAQGFRLRTDAAGTPVGGNVAYVFDASGQQLIRTPKFAVNGTIAYATDMANGGALEFDLTGSHIGRLYYDLSGNFQQKPFEIFNASASYTLPDGHWRGTLFGTNIFDAKPIAGVLISTSTTSVTYQRPATYGARVEYMF